MTYDITCDHCLYHGSGGMFYHAGAVTVCVFGGLIGVFKTQKSQHEEPDQREIKEERGARTETVV